MIYLFHLKLQRMHVSVNKFLWKACWTCGVESLTTAVGFLWQFACEPGHGQDRVQLGHSPGLENPWDCGSLQHDS